MATYTEYLADALRDWREQERQLRRMKEDGREDWEMRDTEKRCAEAFGKCIDTHLMALNGRGQFLVVQEKA